LEGEEKKKRGAKEIMQYQEKKGIKNANLQEKQARIDQSQPAGSKMPSQRKKSGTEQGSSGR